MNTNNRHYYYYAQTLNTRRYQLFSTLCQSLPLFESDDYEQFVQQQLGETNNV